MVITVVVMNMAVPGLTRTGSGTGPPGVGCIAGALTLKMAWNVAPLMMMGLPFIVSLVRLAGVRMSVSEPMPGVTNGGAV